MPQRLSWFRASSLQGEDRQFESDLGYMLITREEILKIFTSNRYDFIDRIYQLKCMKVRNIQDINSDELYEGVLNVIKNKMPDTIKAKPEQVKLYIRTLVLGHLTLVYWNQRKMAL